MIHDDFLITCEHGGNRIPKVYRPLFEGHAALLGTHRGYDPGALGTARALARALAAPLVSSTISRLLVDLNRSLGHPQAFSTMTRYAPAALRTKIIEQHYLPYRQRVEHLVGQSVALGRRVLHISSHSFTPVLDGVVRQADLGLLYDPGRHGEAKLCACWQKLLQASAPELRVRRNYPYLGKGDGLTAYLRQQFDSDSYIGVELEVNQAIIFAGGKRLAALRGRVIDTLRASCGVESIVTGAYPDSMQSTYSTALYLTSH